MPLKNRKQQRDYDRRRYLASAEQVKERRRQYRLLNLDEIAEGQRKDYAVHRAKRLAQKRDYYQRNKETLKAKSKTYRDANLESLKGWRDSYRDRNRERLKDKAMHKRSGFTLASKQATIEAQGGKCAICRTSFKEMRARDIHADHCHAQHKPRGVLCHMCNLGLGRFGDDPELLRAAADYVEQYQLKENTDARSK